MGPDYRDLRSLSALATAAAAPVRRQRAPHIAPAGTGCQVDGSAVRPAAGAGAPGPRYLPSSGLRLVRQALPWLLGSLLSLVAAAAPADPTPYGLDARVIPRAFLRMPRQVSGELPKLLSETGVFTDLRSLTPSAGVLPYDIAVAFWSDGANKSRLVAIPKGTVQFSPTGEWRFPAGTVFVKTFELPTDEAAPQVRRRLETRLLVRDSDGGVYGVDYKWRADNSDAELLTDSVTEAIPIRMKSGEVRQQTWYYPSRKDCLTCHTTLAGGVLGVKTRQMNRSLTFPSGVTDNELRAWNHAGLFSPAIRESDISTFATLAPAGDPNRSLEDRARSYLDANCSQCHRPGGTVAYFDARFDTPLEKQGLINGPVLIDEGIDHPRVISPHDIWRSIAFMRISTNDDVRMPPLARETIDRNGVALMREWIESLPGRDVLAPPDISPAGGTFARSVEVSLRAAQEGVEIRYTLDGSEPGTSDTLYTRPIKLSADSVLRARAYGNGFTHSITAQQLFVVK